MFSGDRERVKGCIRNKKIKKKKIWLKIKFEKTKESFLSFISELTKLTDQENNPDFPKHEGGGPNIAKNV